nr:putative reverse transcriptase domain-containing protein [Tanacetum cinerariifolium]
MTGNISYLFEYEPYDGEYVSFGQGGGKITGKEMELITKSVEVLEGNVTSSKPKRIREAIRMAHDLMDQVVREKTANNGENKIKWNMSEFMLNIISCIKTQKYIHKGCHVFVAYIKEKKFEEKLEEKRLEDVPIVWVFPKVFPGLPQVRQVELLTDLVLGAAPVARAPYRPAPSERQELFSQLQELTDKGFIMPCSSPWGALVLLLRKRMDPSKCALTIVS